LVPFGPGNFGKLASYFGKESSDRFHLGVNCTRKNRQMKVPELPGFDIISGMGPERFRKTIVPGKTKGSIVIKTEGGEDRKIGNPAKEKRIPADILGNLKSLAIEAAVGEFEDSAGQLYLNRELEKLKKKYPEEQPQEVWRRSLATLMAGGVDIESIAGALLSINQRFYVALNLGLLSQAQRSDKLKMIEDKISEYWPSSPNLA